MFDSYVTCIVTIVDSDSMASANNDVTDLITCPVCKDIYTDPKSLKCRHTLCAQLRDGIRERTYDVSIFTQNMCMHAMGVTQKAVVSVILVSGRAYWKSTQCVQPPHQMPVLSGNLL